VSPSWYLNDVSLSLTTDDGCPAYTNLTVFGAQLGVDVSRNGSVSYGTTSSTNPFCFWINNNHDGLGSIRNYLTSDLVQEDLGGSADSSSSTITYTRDLEDFSVLGIQVSELVHQQLTNGNIVVKLEPAGASIKVFPAAAGASIDYLKYGDIATNQITPPYNTYLDMAQPLPAWLWTNSTTTAYLLYEGVGGQGEVKVGLYMKDGTPIGHGQSVWLKLQDVKDMYETWSVGDDNGGTPNPTATNANTFQYSTSSPETSQYILFVHGWNVNADEKTYFANTAYKRLWWQGYKGRFGAFRWPTEYNFPAGGKNGFNLRNFDDSEFVAWNSAAGLSQLLASLNSQYPNNVYLFAHSHGNVVAGEALNLLLTNRTVKTYVACQAAISAHAYDPTTPNRSTRTSNTPDSLAHYPTDIDPCYFNGVTSAAGKADFYNINDYALKLWNLDQRLKPDNGLNYPGYFWSAANNYYEIAGTGPIIHLFFPDDRYKIFSYCVQSPCFALGAAPSVGPFTPVSMSVLWGADPYPDHNFDEHCWHSGEFLFSTVEQWIWWQNLMDSFHLQRN
jgi:hypothetical protein